MANQEHLDILRQGVEIWNQWREEHQNIRPDFSGADLAGADLARINLIGANLATANLVGANLAGAGLSGAGLLFAYLNQANLSDATCMDADFNHSRFNNADLRRTYLARVNLAAANFFGADLCQASFQGANLSDTNLRNADLSNTHFDWANLNHTVLSGANLSGARLFMTTFGNVDLRLVKGLDTIEHLGPSSIGIDTIIRSEGNIPEIFLRGAGIPDTWITYAHSLMRSPVEYYKCFISYASRDEAFAKRLYADLQNKGVRCWFALHDLKIGDHFHQRIDESIRLYDKFVLILSEHAVQSAWVEREVVSAREKEDHLGHEILFPICLDDSVMTTSKAWAADVRRRWHIGDFTQWKDHDAYQLAFERLLRDLKTEHRPID